MVAHKRLGVIAGMTAPLVPLPAAHTIVKLPHWPPNIRDIKKAFVRIERAGTKVVWVSVAKEDLANLSIKQIDFSVPVPVYRGARISTHVRNTPQEISFLGELVQKRGRMYGRRYKITLIPSTRWLRPTGKGTP